MIKYFLVSALLFVLLGLYVEFAKPAATTLYYLIAIPIVGNFLGVLIFGIFFSQQKLNKLNDE